MIWLLNFTILLFAFIRFLRWLSIWQTKEYRLDRFRSFLLSTEGHTELKRIITLPLSLPKLKRPVITPKLTFIALTTLFLAVFIQDLLSSLVSSPIILVSLYLLIPLLIVISTFPSFIITKYFETRYSHKSKVLLAKHEPLIIGITGSFGKTTTKLLLAKLLSSKYKVWTSPKSINTPLALPQIFSSIYQGEPIVIIEFAAYRPQEIARMARLFPPDIAILTGITHQHFSIFGSLKDLLLAKSELPDALIPKAPLFYNHQDLHLQKLVKKYPHLTLIPMSRQKITSPTLSSAGHLHFKLKPGQPIIKTQLVGLHYLSNLTLSIQVAKYLHLSDSQIKFALENFNASAEFIRSHRINSHYHLIIDDRTSNPKGFEAAIDLAKSIPADNKILITSGIVDLGSLSDTIHTKLAIQANQVFDLFIHTSDTARHSFSSVFKSKYLFATDFAKIKSILNSFSSSKNLILIEGKIPSQLMDQIQKINL